MQERELAGEVQAETMTGDVATNSAAMKALKDMLLRCRRNGRAGVADIQGDDVALLFRRDPNTAAGSVILRAFSIRFCTIKLV